MAARRVRLLPLVPRTLRCFVTLSEPLFIQAPDSPDDSGGSLLSFIVGNNFYKRLRVALDFHIPLIIEILLLGCKGNSTVISPGSRLGPGEEN